jgi:hypothetical protein
MIKESSANSILVLENLIEFLQQLSLCYMFEFGQKINPVNLVLEFIQFEASSNGREKRKDGDKEMSDAPTHRYYLSPCSTVPCST